MISALRQLTAAISRYPECLQAQQRHQAQTLPELREALEQELLLLTEAERDMLREALDGIDSDPLREVEA